MTRKRRGWFGRSPKVSAQSLYDQLRVSARLKVQLVEGRPAVAVQYHGATEVLPVPSVEFVRFVDDLRASQRLKPAKPNDMAALCDFIVTMAKDYPDRGPLLALSQSDTGESVPTAPRPTEREGADLTLALHDLCLRERPTYRSRQFWGLSDIEILTRAHRAKQAVLLVGPPGSGKTTCVEAAAFDLGLPMVRFSCHDGLEVDDLIGKYVRSGGEWRWRWGKLVTLVRHGGIALADEIDSARPEMLARIHSLLEPRRTLSVPEHKGEEIEAHPDFQFVATANPPNAGGRALAPRMVDRFAVRLDFPYDARIEAEVCPNPRVLAAFQALRADKRIRSAPLSTRLLAQYAANQQVYGPKIALGLLLGGFASEERLLVRQALTSPLELEAEEPAEAAPTVNFYDRPRRPVPASELLVRP
jgi:hypothetical protein